MCRHLAVVLAATGTWREMMYAAPTANVAHRRAAVNAAGQVELMEDQVLMETWELECTQTSLDAMLADPDTTLAVLQEAFAGEITMDPGEIAVRTSPAMEKTVISFAEAANRAASWKEHQQAKRGKAEFHRYRHAHHEMRNEPAHKVAGGLVEHHTAVHMHEGNPTLTIEFDIKVAKGDAEQEIEAKLAAFDISGTVDAIEKLLNENGVAVEEFVSFKEVSRGGTGAAPVEAIEDTGGDAAEDAADAPAAIKNLDADADAGDADAVAAKEAFEAEPNAGGSTSIAKSGSTIQVLLAVLVVVGVIATAYGVYKMHKAKDDDYEAGEFEEEEEEYEEE